MAGTRIFITFFILFTVASILLPTEFPPGSLIDTWMKTPENYEKYFSAIINGLVYSAIIWVVFVTVSKKIAEE